MINFRRAFPLFQVRVAANVEGMETGQRVEAGCGRGGEQAGRTFMGIKRGEPCGNLAT